MAKISLLLVCILLLFSIQAQTCLNPNARLQYIRSIHFDKDSLYKRIENDLGFIHFNAGDTVADIGSYDGYYPAMYSVFSDSVVFYLNDISMQGFAYFDSILLLCSKTKAATVSNKFKIIIGCDTSTNLPVHRFNKVILRDALHHFKFRSQMLTDIKRIMKKDSELLLFEPVKTPDGDNGNLCKGAMTREELIDLLKKNGFELTRQLMIGKSGNWFGFNLATAF